MTSSGERGFHPNSGRLTMIADSDAADHFVDDELIPGLRQRTMTYKKLEEPKPIDTAGNERSSQPHPALCWGMSSTKLVSLSGSHLSHDRSWPGTQPILPRQSNAIGCRHDT